MQYRTTGTAPFRVFTVEWKDVCDGNYGSCATGSTRFSFQVQLHETTNKIRFHYGPTPPPNLSNTSASVGIQEKINVGIAALACTTSSAGTCGAAHWPANQAIDFTLPPDLVVSNLSGDQVGYAGVPFRGTVTAKNLGGRGAPNVKVQFYLSTDPVLDAGDIRLGETMPTDLDTLQEVIVAASAPIPNGTATGNYFLLAQIDPDNLVAEQDETNNVSPPIVLRVGPPTPDLVVTTISGPQSATPGGTVSISRIITNAGNADATTPFKYTYFLSDNSVVTVSDQPLSPVNQIASLAVNASDTRTEQLTLPANLNAGRYWVGVCLDYDPSANPTSTLTEISEVNNCATAGGGFIVNTGQLTVITNSLPGATQYAPYGLRLQATGGDGSYSWALTGGSLPKGMSFSTSGDLTGAPAAPGSFSFRVKVTSGGGEATANLSLQVTPANLPLAIVDQELPVAEFGKSYQARLVAVGGKPPYVWTLKPESRLPAGLALSTDGTVEGRASEAVKPGEANEFPFSVELKDAAGAQAAKDLRVRVVLPTAMHIATRQLAVGHLRKEYLQVLQAVGGEPPYDWSIVKFQQLAENPTDQPGKPETAIPADFGIKVEEDPSGQDVLRGLPQKAGLFAITLRVQDSAGNEDITTLPLQITYDEGLAITTTALPDAFVGHPYNARLSHNGGQTAVDVQFSIACVKQAAQNLEDFGCAPTDLTQTLPAGLFLGADGLISGTPAPVALPQATDERGNPVPVTFSFLVKLTDKSGRQDVRGLSIKVRPDYEKVQKGGCSGAAGGPALLALLSLAGLAVRRRR